MPSIKQLRYFEALAKLEHFGRAADACAVTQPALSVQIRELEDELGVTLIERRARGMRVTDAGREVADRAKHILGSVRDLVDSSRKYKAILSGSLNLGVIPSIAPYVLPRLLRVLRTNHSELKLHVREAQTNSLLPQLIDGTLDVLLLALPVEHPDIETHALFEDRFLLALPPGCKFPSDKRATTNLLNSNNVLLLEDGHCFRDHALKVCKLRQIKTIDMFGASSLSTLAEMASAGLGVTFLPELCLDMETSHCDVQLMRFEDPEPSRTIGLAWRSKTPRRSDFMALGEYLAR